MKYGKHPRWRVYCCMLGGILWCEESGCETGMTWFFLIGMWLNIYKLINVKLWLWMIFWSHTHTYYGISSKNSPILSWLLKCIPPLILCRKQDIILDIELWIYHTVKIEVPVALQMLCQYNITLCNGVLDFYLSWCYLSVSFMFCLEMYWVSGINFPFGTVYWMCCERFFFFLSHLDCLE